MATEEDILKGFNDILEGVSDDRVQETLDYVAMCLDPETPSHEISIIELISTTMRFYHSVNAQDKDNYDQLIKRVNEILEERGYRTNYSTYQEHLLMGSTQWIGYSDKPHKPLGVIEGDLTVAEANEARALAKRQGAFGKHFCSEDTFVLISLELLDEDGNTVRDPQHLDTNLNPIETTYSPDFPFRR